MDFFKFFIFGITGVSVVFWVAVITLWHAYMFPKIFSETDNNSISDNDSLETDSIQEPILGSLVSNQSLLNRNKYSMRSIVIADFSSLNNFKLNKLYTLVSLSIVFATFTLITYGLHSALIF